jgi:hypothetical protein
MINQDLFLRFGAALLIGVLIGMQREYAYSTNKEGGLFAGARTFALMSLFGALAALLSDLFLTPWVFIGLIILLGVMIIVAYFISATERDEIGLTTEVAALITMLIGGICYLHSLEVAAALGVVTTVLLAVKWELRQFVKVITQEDVFATLQFAVITAIVLPVLPNRTFGPLPLDVLNPYQIWKMVISLDIFWLKWLVQKKELVSAAYWEDWHPARQPHLVFRSAVMLRMGLISLLQWQS